MDMINLAFEEKRAYVAQILDFIYMRGKLRASLLYGSV